MKGSEVNMGFFEKPRIYSKDELLTINFVTLGHAIRSLLDVPEFDLESTYKYWDLFTWNLDTVLENGHITTSQANYILEATEQPFRNAFVL